MSGDYSEVWAITGEEGNVYGLVSSEADAWAFVATEARQSIFECGTKQEVEDPADLRLHYLIRCRDDSRERDIIVSDRWMHDLTNQSVHGVYHLTPVALPGDDSPTRSDTPS